MTVLLKADTQVVVQFGPFLDKTNGVDLEASITAGTLDHVTTGIRISKNGGTFAARAATVTASAYDAHGMYKITLNTGDVDTEGTLRMVYDDAATCLPVWQDFMVVPANVYDSLVLGTDTLNADVTQFSGGAIPAPAVTGVPDVNVTHAADTAWASGAITAASIATDAIGSAELAATAVDEIADAVWNEDATGHQTQGTFGQAIGDPVADATTIYQAVATDAAGDNVAIDVIAVKGQTAAIETDTGEIGTAGIGLSNITVAGLAAGIIDDTSVGTLTNSNFAFVDANERVDVGQWLGTAATSGTGGPDVNVNAISDSTAAAVNLEASALTIVPAVCEGTPSTTVIQTDLAEATDDHYIGRVAIFIDGAAAYQASDITDYAGATGTITVTALTTAPAASDNLVII